MTISEEYTFETILKKSYLIPIKSKNFSVNDAICLNETGAFLLGVVAKESPTTEELVAAACQEYEPDNEEEVREVTEMVEEFLRNMMDCGYVNG